MKKRWLVLLPLVALVVAGLACGGDDDATTAPGGGGDTSGDDTVTLVLDNESSFTVCDVYISPSDDQDWGADQLDDEVGPGESHTFRVEPGEYDLKAEDCEGDLLDTQASADLSDASTWTLSDPDDDDAGTGDGLDYSLTPAYGEEDLSPDFQPDPFTVELIAGGSIDVDDLDLGSECTGYAASAPDFRLNWGADSGALNIFFVSDDGDDTVLIVSDASGAWHCNDDAEGNTFDPMLAFSSTPEGTYDIWVATYTSGENEAGTLYITEMDYSPTNLP